MVNGDRTSGVLGGTGDPSQAGSQLRVPIHHLALSDHDHDLTAAMVFHIGDERLIRQRSNSPGTDSGRMNGRRNRRLRRSDPRHQPRSKRGTDRDRPQRAMLQEPTARLISHGILQFRNKPAPPAMSERGHTALSAGGSPTPTRRHGSVWLNPRNNTWRPTPTALTVPKSLQKATLPARPVERMPERLPSRSVSKSSAPGRARLRGSADRRRTGSPALIILAARDGPRRGNRNSRTGPAQGGIM